VKRWRKPAIWLVTSLLVISAGVGSYFAVPRLLAGWRCALWPELALPGLEAGRDYIFVAMGACNTAVAIDTERHAVVAAARLGGRFPHGIAISPDGQEFYAANQRSDTVSVVALPQFTLVATIPAGNFPTDLVPSVEGGRMFLTNFKGGSVQVLDRFSRSVVREVASPRATHFAEAPDGKRLYVTNWDNRLTVLDGGGETVIKVIPLPGKPNHATVSRDSRRIYVTLYGDSALAVVDAGRLEVIATIPVGLHPMAPAVTPDGRWVYVSNIDSGTVSVVDTERLTVVGEIRTGGTPQHPVMDRLGRTLWVSNPEREAVQVLDLASRRVVREIYTGPEPQQMAPRYLGAHRQADTSGPR